MRTELTTSSIACAALLAYCSLTGMACHETEGQVSIEISRLFSTPEEEALIMLAESTDPPRQDIIDYIGHDSPEFPADGFWWFDIFDGIPVPWAITTEAINFFETYAADFRDSNPRPHTSVRYSYTAGISREESYEIEGVSFSDVYVVTMRMDWYYVCGGLCGLFFDKDRIVIFSPGGDVLRIVGDGPTEFAVS